ncbi:MAG: hypothetical protein LUD72_05775 [Bacteroidales bacterium]|nr:hypothetical protein [Bacteroidales bacterium]
MANEIRIGKVSTVDYENGMVAVVYTDKDDAVTKSLPMLSFNGEYKMPERDEMVLVVHLSNGSEAGIVLGTYWNKAHHPSVTGQGVYRKDISADSYVQYQGGTLEIDAPSISLNGTTVEEILRRIEALEARDG